MTETEATDRPLVHVKCGGPVDVDPSSSELRRDHHALGWQAFGAGVLFLALGAIFPPLWLGALALLLAPALWLMAATGLGIDADRRCPACRRSWKVDGDRKHARPENRDD